MPQTNHPKQLDERTTVFAEQVRSLLRALPKDCCNSDARQLERSSGSIAANYIEAQAGISKKDFLLRLRIARKEARESMLWLRLLHTPATFAIQQSILLQEAKELTYMLSAAIKTVQTKGK